MQRGNKWKAPTMQSIVGKPQVVVPRELTPDEILEEEIDEVKSERLQAWYANINEYVTGTKGIKRTWDMGAQRYQFAVDKSWGSLFGMSTNKKLKLNSGRQLSKDATLRQTQEDQEDAALGEPEAVFEPNERVFL